MARRALVGAVLLLLTACAGAATSPPPAAGRVRASPGPSASTGAPASPGRPHVFVVVMENHGYTQAMAQPYTAALAARYAVATDYHAVSHPSLPNYLALTGGSTFGITDDDYHRLPAGGIGLQLSQHGIPWRAYMEGMTAGCFNSPSPYALKHNPFAYFGGGCPPEVVPLTRLDADLAGDTPAFVWITPDLCHDGHSCTARQADDFLGSLVPRILASAAWQRDGLLLITWDEDDGNEHNQVPALIVAPGQLQHVAARPADHYSLLATVEDRLGVPRLGQAQQATSLTDLLS